MIAKLIPRGIRTPADEEQTYKEKGKFCQCQPVYWLRAFIVKLDNHTQPLVVVDKLAYYGGGVKRKTPPF
jgi:hypothetical protein